MDETNYENLKITDAEANEVKIANSADRPNAFNSYRQSKMDSASVKKMFDKPFELAMEKHNALVAQVKTNQEDTDNRLGDFGADKRSVAERLAAQDTLVENAKTAAEAANTAANNANEATAAAHAAANEILADKAAGVFKGEKGDKGDDGKDDVAREAVNTLRADLENSIGAEPDTSVLEIPRIDDRYYRKESAEYADGDGKHISTGSQCTELVSVMEGQKFYVTGQYGYLSCLIAEFDENQNFIQGVGTNESGNKVVTDYEYTVPNGVAYVAFSTRSVSASPLIIKGATFRKIGEEIDALSEDVEELKETVSGLGGSTDDGGLAEDVEEIKSRFVSGKNLHNPANDFITNKRPDGSGNGLGLRSSEWISVEKDKNYIVSVWSDSGSSLLLGVNNANGEFKAMKWINSMPSSTSLLRTGYSYTPTEDGESIRVCPQGSDGNYKMDYLMIEQSDFVTEFEPYTRVINQKYLPKGSENQWLGKHLVVDGDSITHAYKNTYWQFRVADMLGMNLDVSSDASMAGNGWKGIGGSTIANEGGKNDAEVGIVLRYQNYSNDADLVVIAGGTNDWAHGIVPMGETDSQDDKTFNGALNVLLKGLKDKYPTKTIVMLTPIKRYEHGLKIRDLTLGDFADAMIKKCREYGIYCLDMWGNCPLDPDNEQMAEMFFKPNSDGESDRTHPNDLGHEIMAKTVVGFLKGIVG